ncbi:MAG TPA: hypothetical protein PKM88_11390 [bacterium]|nr:hypothetical protein [bacterium]
MLAVNPPLLVGTTPAQAHLALDTGSGVAQRAAAFLFGFVFAIKLYW